MQCQDVYCTECSHTEDQDKYTLDILSNVVECCHTTIPMSGGSAKSGKHNHRNVPGWTEEVEPFRQLSIYWHNVWQGEGRIRLW